MTLRRLIALRTVASLLAEALEGIFGATTRGATLAAEAVVTAEALGAGVALWIFATVALKSLGRTSGRNDAATARAVAPSKSSVDCCVIRACPPALSSDTRLAAASAFSCADWGRSCGLYSPSSSRVRPL
ncbi:hypothetical protein RD1_1831 [Roseobacter denitrificans OCh 114]|uniref:Uncharacterized protein n=1 Tax=Roseobacter denitrificans (strain ATCC 33942 / OCh 114) TaxID=375451 RepID=Q168Z5_ROSDO|nr:hypothetical protein RD1_1831 [Roseobacter denitrificans OCh 114]